MHDPQTVAFEIRRPWAKKPQTGKFKYYPSIITIWHVDPETDGSDDSCGWHYKLTQKDIAWCEKTAVREHKITFGYEDLALGHASSLEIVWAVWCLVRHGLLKKHKGYIYAPLPHREMQEIMALVANPADNISRIAQQAKTSVESFQRLLMCVARNQSRYFRPWYRHPRWHIHHWRIQIHFNQDLKRWLFSRCKGCGKRFTWGYAPVSTQWHGDGPQWFKGERTVYHHGCAPCGKMREEPAHG